MPTKYPYMPPGRKFKFADQANEFMSVTRDYARVHSLDKTMPGAAVVVRDGIVIGIGSNGSTYHETHGCERIRRGIPTGQGYELCEGCHPKNHSEPSAIADARRQGHATQGADLYLWGHWWCCEPCWSVITAAGIKQVYLLEGSEVLFNKSDPDNVVGHQFDEMSMESGA